MTDDLDADREELARLVLGNPALAPLLVGDTAKELAASAAEVSGFARAPRQSKTPAGGRLRRRRAATSTRTRHNARGVVSRVADAHPTGRRDWLGMSDAGGPLVATYTRQPRRHPPPKCISQTAEEGLGARRGVNEPYV